MRSTDLFQLQSSPSPRSVTIIQRWFTRNDNWMWRFLNYQIIGTKMPLYQIFWQQKRQRKQPSSRLSPCVNWRLLSVWVIRHKSFCPNAIGSPTVGMLPYGSPSSSITSSILITIARRLQVLDKKQSRVHWKSFEHPNAFAQRAVS